MINNSFYICEACGTKISLEVSYYGSVERYICTCGLWKEYDFNGKIIFFTYPISPSYKNYDIVHINYQSGYVVLYRNNSMKGLRINIKPNKIINDRHGCEKFVDYCLKINSLS